MPDPYYGGPDGFEQKRNTGGSFPAEGEGVAMHVQIAAEDNIDRLQAAQGLEKHAVMPDREIGSFDEGVTEIARQIRVFRVGFAQRARGQQHDPGIFAMPGGDAGQRLV